MKARLFMLPCLLLCCVLLSSCLAEMSSYVPNMPSAVHQALGHGDKIMASRQDFTPEQEYYLGRAVAAQLLSRYPAKNDVRANTYLNRLGQALALYSTRPETFSGYHFLLLDTDEVNAFAAPGGLIFITTGMLNLVSNEGELAAVLAHEIAHVQNNDAVKAIQSSRLTAALTALGQDAASHYAGGRVSPQLLNIFSDTVGDITATLVSKGYSRDQEYATDAAARDILSRAGYDPRSLHVVLRAMQKSAPGGSAGFGSTHPTAEQRLKALRATEEQPVKDSEARSRRFQAALAAYSSK